MKILRLNAYYLPEKTASTHLFIDINEGFEKAGIDYIIITPMPTRGISRETQQNYARVTVEKTNGGYVTVKRFPLFGEGNKSIIRAIRYIVMSIKEYKIAVKEKKVNAVFSSSTPPTQGYLAAKVARRLSKKYRKKIPFVYNLQDVFPDSLVNAGFTKQGSLIWKIGRKIEDYTYRNADKIIVISEGFKRNIMKKGVPEEKIEVVSNWIDLDTVYPVERKNNKLISEFCLEPNKFIVVYAGNFGSAQGADIVLKAASKLQHIKEIKFAIFGGGTQFNDAKEVAKDMENVFIHDLMPQDRISEVYSLGDVALITCKKGTGNAGMPSKTWSIMACNTTIIASFDRGSDLENVLEASCGGICIEPENEAILVNSILAEFAKWKIDGKLSVGSRKYVEQHAEKKVCIQRYIGIINECARQCEEGVVMG